MATSALGCTLPHTPGNGGGPGQCAAGEGLGSGASRPKKCPALVLTAWDLDLSPLSHGCVLGWVHGSGVRSTSGTTPYVRASWGSVGDRTTPPGSGILLGLFGTSRVVPPLRLIDLSPFPRNEGGPRQEAHHQPVLTASGLDLSYLLAVCPGLSA